jgi:hypothetical protein
MTRTALLCSTALMFFATGTTLAAERAKPAMHFHGIVHRVIAAVPGAVTLYDQNSDDAGVGVISENFVDGGFYVYDSYGADDFSVPLGHRWKIREVDVSGVYGSQTLPAQSEDVIFYLDKKGLPGKPVAQCLQLTGKDTLGSFAIRLPNSCKVTLKGGKRYWVSVVANENDDCCTSWGWETRNGQNGNPAAWENPNDGYRTDCETWGAMKTCTGLVDAGPDFMFALKGTDAATSRSRY